MTNNSIAAQWLAILDNTDKRTDDLPFMDSIAWPMGKKEMEQLHLQVLISWTLLQAQDFMVCIWVSVEMRHICDMIGGRKMIAVLKNTTI